VSTVEAREPRLDALGIVLAVIHAAALTIVCWIAFIALVDGRTFFAVWRKMPWPTTDPAISLLGGTFVGWCLVLLSRAARRSRVGFGRGERVVVIVSGLICGLLGLPVVMIVYSGGRW